MEFVELSFALMAAAAAQTVVVSTPPSPPPPDMAVVFGGLGHDNIPISFETGNGWVYDGRIELPAEDQRRAWAVMLLGGALGTSIDWWNPSEFTIDGKATRDADTLTVALLRSGFIVMRWQAIRRGDPQHAKDPLMLDPPSFTQTVEQARNALAAFRDTKVVRDDHIFLLGHSLGAKRACLLLATLPGAPGIVMLAGAGLVGSELEIVREIAGDAATSFAAGDRNADGWIDTAEWAQIKPDSTLASVDLDSDKRISRHEWAVEILGQSSKRWRPSDAANKDRYGYRWGVDALSRYETPLLSVVGDLDERWLLESYLLTSHLRERGHPDWTWRVLPNMGHQLGAEVKGPVTYKDMGVMSNSKTGPISPDAVNLVVSWLNHRAR